MLTGLDGVLLLYFTVPRGNSHHPVPLIRRSTQAPQLG